MSRRSEESVTAWRDLVLESDVAEMDEWLRCLVQLQLRTSAIYTSGGKSVHALVRLDARSKAEWDERHDLIRSALVPLGADANALTGVRLSRLPGAMRAGIPQELLYLNPNPTTVDDWRYDEPNYFADGRVPNVVLHVERKQTDGRWESVPFRASSQGGGANLERLNADVSIDVFPGSSNIQVALMLQLSKKAVAEKKSEEAFKQEMMELEKAFRAESLGEFRLTATYIGFREAAAA